MSSAISDMTNGMTFRPYQIEYEIPISSAAAEVFRYSTSPASGLIGKFREALGFHVPAQLAISDDNGWAIFIMLFGKDDTPENRETISEVLLQHIDTCMSLVEEG